MVHGCSTKQNVCKYTFLKTKKKNKRNENAWETGSGRIKRTTRRIIGLDTRNAETIETGSTSINRADRAQGSKENEGHKRTVVVCFRFAH